MILMGRPLIHSEKRLEKKLYEAVNCMGGVAIKNTPFGHKNLPDRTIYLPGGKIYLAEVKSTGDKPNDKQRNRIEFFKQLGFTVFIIDSEETLKNAILVMSGNIHL